MKTKKLILLFSHKLTPEQIKSAKDDFDVKEFIYLSKELQNIWSNIDPDIEKIDLQPIKEFLKDIANKDDVVLIQGDFGACYNMVNFCKSLKLVTVYATTKRVAKEFIEDGNTIKKSEFKFRRFREYE